MIEYLNGLFQCDLCFFLFLHQTNVSHFQEKSNLFFHWIEHSTLHSTISHKCKSIILKRSFINTLDISTSNKFNKKYHIFLLTYSSNKKKLELFRILLIHFFFSNFFSLFVSQQNSLSCVVRLNTNTQTKNLLMCTYQKSKQKCLPQQLTKNPPIHRQ